MGRTPCCDKQLGLKKGPWTPEEDKVLVDYIQANGHGSWRSLPKLAGLQRCGKSCRLRWANYLRPDIKRGPFTEDEQKSIIQLHGIVGNKWSAIAAQLPGRTDNEIKNFWNTHLKKRLQRMGINPDTCSSSPPTNNSTSSATSASSAAAAAAARHMAQWESARLEAEARLHLCPSNTTSTNHEHEHVDVFLRIWNSDVGEAFRRTRKAENNEEASQSSAVTVSEANNAGTEMAGELKNEAEETSEEEETYRFYLDLAAGDDLSLLHVDQMGSCCYSLLGSDLTEASLDNPF